MTMDILWALAHPPPSSSSNYNYSMSGSLDHLSSSGMPYHHTFPGAGIAAGAGIGGAGTGAFAVPTPPYADGSWDMYQDYVGGVQFWGYALVSGSGDGAVRMWDSKFDFNFMFICFLFSIAVLSIATHFATHSLLMING